MSAQQFGHSINVEIPKGVLDTEAFDDLVEDALVDIALAARAFWEAEAGRRLKTSREEYQRAIGMVQTGRYETTVQLSGDAQNAGSRIAVKIEDGANAYSLRPGFMRSPSIKKKRIPRAIAEHMKQMTGQAPAKKWMVVPINATGAPPGPGGRVANPVFRMFTDTQPRSMWNHPGFQGVHIADTVQKELLERIIPEHMDKLIDKAFNT